MRRSPLLLAVPVAIAIAAGCSGGGAGAHGPTPTPTATTTPLEPDSCEIVWISVDASNPDLHDDYIVDAPIEDWTSGTALPFTVNGPLAIFFDDYDTGTHEAYGAAIATAGTYSLTLGNGTTSGGTIAFSDAGGKEFFALDQMTGIVGAKVASNGSGSFTGVWTAPESSTPIAGSGTVTVAWMDSSLSLGTLGRYARCYHGTAIPRMLHMRNTLREI